MFRHRRTISLACLAVTAGLMYSARGQEESPAKPAAASSSASDDKIQDLLEQRQQVLESRVEMIRGVASQGSLRMDELFRAENDALRASLELAEDQQATITIREKILENCRKIEEIVQMYQQNGAGRIHDFLLVKANRITAEIELARARSKMTAAASQ